MSPRNQLGAYSKDRRKKYRLFISHSWKYSDEYNRMVKLLNDANRFEWDNYSVPEEKEIDASSKDELWAALREQIKPSSVVIVLAGMYVEDSTWIKREMISADTYDKPIIGVEPWGNSRTPFKVKEYADTIVGWQSSSVVDAVRKRSP